MQKNEDQGESTQYEILKNYISNELEVFTDEDQLERIVDIVLRHEAHTQHVGYAHYRCEFNPREKAFFEQWMKENSPNPAINAGHGILQDLFFEPDKNSLSMRHGHFVHIMNERDRMIAATVIQWLGTNCGMAFLYEALKRFDHTIRPTK